MQILRTNERSIENSCQHICSNDSKVALLFSIQSFSVLSGTCLKKDKERHMNLKKDLDRVFSKARLSAGN